MYIDSRMGKRVVMYLCNEMSCDKEKRVTADTRNLDVSNRPNTE